MTSHLKHHPVFARLYAWASPRAEAVGTAEHREQLLSGLEGRVVEVGCGNGLNFVHYPRSVTEVVAVEPEPYLRARAAEAAKAAQVPVLVMDGAAEQIPVAGGTFDAAVASLVLCSVGDLPGSLAEIRRVLRPGGELRFYEHVRSEAPGLQRTQERWGTAWSHLAGGCRPDRDTVGAIEAGGFEVEEIRRFDFLLGPRWMCGVVAPHVLGIARAA